MRKTVEAHLAGHKFRVTWLDPATAVAEIGSRRMNAIFQDGARYMKVGIRLRTLEQGQTSFRLMSISGFGVGNAITRWRNKRELRSLAAELEAEFKSLRVLRSMTDAWDEGEWPKNP